MYVIIFDKLTLQNQLGKVVGFELPFKKKKICLASDMFPVRGFFFFFFLINLYWSITALQFYVSFYFRAK